MKNTISLYLLLLATVIGMAMPSSEPLLGQSAPLSATHLAQSDREYPEFVGGDGAMNRYLRAQIRYPRAAYEQKISGTVYIEFTVSETGKVVNPKVVKGVNADLDDEALRVVSSFPDWLPAIVRGQPVAKQVVVPIPFSISYR